MKNAYNLNIQISDLNKTIFTIKKAVNGLAFMQWTFTIATFAFYFSFVSVIYAGVSIWGLQDYLFSKSANVIALIWTLIVIIFAPLALSLGKHFNYKSIADNADHHDKKIIIVRSMILLALLSGLYYEAISSSANLQSKAFHAVDYQGNLNTILSGSNSVSTDSVLSGELSKAQVKLAQCTERWKAGKEKHCEGDKARVNSLTAQTAASLQASSNASAAAITTKGNVLKSAVDEQTLPAAKWFSQSFGTSNDGGTMMIVIIAALFFELIHLATIFSEIRLHVKQLDSQRLLQGLQSEYYGLTGKIYNPSDFKDDRVIDLSQDELQPQPSIISDPDFKITTKGQPYKDNKTGFGFVPQSAKQGLFKWELDEKPLPAKPERVFGFIRHGQKAGDGEESLAASNRKNYPQTIIMPTGSGKTPDDYAPVQRVDTPRFPYTVGGNVTERNPLKTLDTPINGAGTESNGAGTESNGAGTESNILRFTRFEDIPLYGRGKCKWCGSELTGKQKDYCCTDHKNKWWNLFKPSNKRFKRV